MSDDSTSEGPSPVERIEAVGERLNAILALFLREAKDPKTKPERAAEIAAWVERTEKLLDAPRKQR